MATDVLTYHNDVGRTGWNQTETQLTPDSVKKSFARIHTTQLGNNDQVDAQPLVVSHQLIEGLGQHTVVYVVTENDTVYAIDGISGAILLTRSLGTAVPRPFDCNNGANFVGINSTPTIDKKTNTLYVVAYVLESETPVYQLHALALDTLQDTAGSPVTASGAAVLSDGTSIRFDAQHQRQRPALLDSNGKIYAAFGSFCDFKASESRGWVLAWDKQNLAAPPIASVNDRLPQSITTLKCTYQSSLGETPCFLSSIWMSGYGLSADSRGNVYFNTGNSAKGTYDSSLNVSESLVKLGADLSLAQVFSPANLADLDNNDNDFGSGGALAIPDHFVPGSHLVLAGGKDGRLFVVDSDNMGGHETTDIPSQVGIGNCFCGPSIYITTDGPRVVSSGENQVQTWAITTAEQNRPTLSHIATAPPMERGQSGGFFTSISSDGLMRDTAIIWALSRPINLPPGTAGINHHITLYAYADSQSSGGLDLIWSGAAGTWTFGGNGCCHANLVPTVANGHVYVATENQLEIFSSPSTPMLSAYLSPIKSLKSSDLYVAPVYRRAAEAQGGAQYWGQLIKADSKKLRIKLRSGKSVVVDIEGALKNETVKIPRIHGFALVKGEWDPQTHDFKARSVSEIMEDPYSWGVDRER